LHIGIRLERIGGALKRFERAGRVLLAPDVA
jgi:hypothetical protein